MDFLTTDDIKLKLRTDRSNQITDSDSDVYDTAEAQAISMVIDATNQWYDINHELSRTGADRNATLVRWVSNLTVYFMYERVSDNMVPDRVVKNYDDVLDELKRVEDRKRHVKLKEKETDGVKETRFQWGSQPAREHDPYTRGNRNDPTMYN